MKKIIIAGAIIAVFLQLNSCASFKTIFKEPEVSFDSMRISGIDFNSAGFIFKYKVNNPNAVSLDMHQFKYDFYVEDNVFLSGTSLSPISIAKEAFSYVEIPVDIEYKKLFSVVKDLMKKDTAAYRIEAEFTFNLPVFGKAVFPVKYEGTFPVLKLPDVSFKSFKAVSITPFSAKLELAVEIFNKNSFAISPDSFNFDFTVNKSQWVKGIIKDINEMAPGKSTIVKIPVDINPAKIGKELFEYIFKGNSFDMILDGVVNVRTAYPGLGPAVIPFRIEKNTPITK